MRKILSHQKQLKKEEGHEENKIETDETSLGGTKTMKSAKSSSTTRSNEVTTPSRKLQGSLEMIFEDQPCEDLEIVLKIVSNLFCPRLRICFPSEMRAFDQDFNKKPFIKKKKDRREKDVVGLQGSSSIFLVIPSLVW